MVISINIFTLFICHFKIFPYRKVKYIKFRSCQFCKLTAAFLAAPFPNRLVKFAKSQLEIGVKTKGPRYSREWRQRPRSRRPPH